MSSAVCHRPDVLCWSTCCSQAFGFCPKFVPVCSSDDLSSQPHPVSSRLRLLPYTHATADDVHACRALTWMLTSTRPLRRHGLPKGPGPSASCVLAEPGSAGAPQHRACYVGRALGIAAACAGTTGLAAPASAMAQLQKCTLICGAGDLRNDTAQCVKHADMAAGQGP